MEDDLDILAATAVGEGDSTHEDDEDEEEEEEEDEEEEEELLPPPLPPSDDDDNDGDHHGGETGEEEEEGLLPPPLPPGVDEQRTAPALLAGGGEGFAYEGSHDEKEGEEGEGRELSTAEAWEQRCQTQLRRIEQTVEEYNVSLPSQGLCDCSFELTFTHTYTHTYVYTRSPTPSDRQPSGNRWRQHTTRVSRGE